MPQVYILPDKRILQASSNQILLDVLSDAGIVLDASCSGGGTCGKCRVIVDGQEMLACQVRIEKDLTVLIPDKNKHHILKESKYEEVKLNPRVQGYQVAFDIGTTTVVCYLMEGKSGKELAVAGSLNPQITYGADVVARIRAAISGKMDQQSRLIRETMTSLILKVCGEAKVSPEMIISIAVVGNPAMKQLFFGIGLENLAAPPFMPAAWEAYGAACENILPVCSKAKIITLPDISGYVGADTLGCVISTGMHQSEKMTLLVDIGTNGEMVLGNRKQMVACAAAAGPALEGAHITFGMRGEDGAIDHVWVENGTIASHVMGEVEPRGICGSGLIDAVSAALELGLLNKRGRIREVDGQRVISIAEGIYLTQEDIRQVQLAKGAIQAGIILMAEQIGISLNQIDQVLLAGAFGTYMDPASACRIGLLPEELSGKTRSVGNAAGSGAKMLALDPRTADIGRQLAGEIEFLELAKLEAFPKSFAKSMLFREV